MTFLKNKQIVAAVLSAALLVPASSAFANDWTKHHSRLRGATIGATVGALAGPPGMVVGGAIGNGVQYVRGHHHYRHHRYASRTYRHYRRY